MQKISPKQYAQAIYSLAKQENIATKIIADLKEVEDKLTISPSFFAHLASSKQTLSQKEKDLKKVFNNFISQKTYRIITLLIKNRHLGWLDKVILELDKIKKEDEKILDTNIYVPMPMDDAQKTKLKTILTDKTKKTIIIHQIIKPEIIGGMKIDLNGLIIDGSIAGRLDKLERSIKNI